MANTRRISGHATLQCNADASHKWEEEYSVRADQHGNPDRSQLEYFLKIRRVKCPHCGHISYKIISVIVATVHP